MIRRAAVAGSFYPASKDKLQKDVQKYLNTGARPRDAIGVISPHAGYMYSGAVAGAVFSSVNVPKRVIVLSPNHTGRGTPASIMSEGMWELPNATITIDAMLATALKRDCPELKEDAIAHLGEHSIEVQLPFLFVREPALKFVPITVAHLRYDMCERIGKAMAETVKKMGEKVLIVASSDMTHYEPREVAKHKDRRAIDQVLALDPKGLLQTCAADNITMCGVIPSAIMLIAARELGATKAELVKYATSGEVTGDNNEVVGYAGMIISV